MPTRARKKNAALKIHRGVYFRRDSAGIINKRNCMGLYNNYRLKLNIFRAVTRHVTLSLSVDLFLFPPIIYTYISTLFY